ncbi:MAG: ACP S-malonyltransferase [Lachnospiraceae bacterium]|jgi:[acyl-carrier-protein] S-malonyltransferase
MDNKIAFVFAGQGAQAPGMGADFYESSPAAKAVFDKADEIRPGTSGQCFSGTDEELRITKNTQPCLYAVESAIAAALSEAGIEADMTAGFSLGELSALAYSGAVDMETGMRLVVARSTHMQEAAEKADTSMAAVVKLTNDQVKEVCGRFERVYPVNFNCPGQVSVSGDAEEMKQLGAAVKAEGGRMIPLKVNGAFHSPFMTPAAENFAEDLAKIKFNERRIALYSNYTAAPYEDNEAELLAKQVDHPVLWEKIVRKMADAGVDTFVEIGPGKTLTGLIKKTLPDVKTYNVAAVADLEALREALA